jgi:hypothetical protein
MSLNVLSIYLLDCFIQVNKDISSFTFVTDYELGIVINDNKRARINLEGFITNRDVHLEKQDIYKQTSNTCVLIGHSALCFDCEIEMYSSNVKKYIKTVRVNFLIQLLCVSPSFSD